jgi:hypothetical protein
MDTTFLGTSARKPKFSAQERLSTVANVLEPVAPKLYALGTSGVHSCQIGTCNNETQINLRFLDIFGKRMWKKEEI